MTKLFKKVLTKNHNMKINNSKFSRLYFEFIKRGLPKSNRSQSEVITTVLLILISIAAVGTVIAFVMPFIKERMSGSDCLDLANEISIANNPDYTCYNNIDSSLSVQIHVGDLKGKSSSFGISVSVAGTSTNYKITSTSLDAGVSIRGGSNIPNKNEERTYIITGIGIPSKPDSIIVYPILNDGKTCDSPSHDNDIPVC